MPKEKQEEKVSMFDPVVNAFREIPISIARKLIEEAKRLEKILEAKEKNE